MRSSPRPQRCTPALVSTQDEDSVAWAERVSGLALDPWQRDVLLADDARLAILCCRQSGKSTIVALKAADLVRRGGLAVVVAPSLRQSSLLFRKLNRLLVAGGESFRRETATELETARGGLALCLPGDRPDMLRGLSLRWPTTSLLIVDEAARVRETMWATISPMLAAAPLARQALLSTPAGASGEFHRVMTSRESDWRRITVTAPRIARASRRPSLPASASGSARRSSSRSTTASSSLRPARSSRPTCSRRCSAMPEARRGRRAEPPREIGSASRFVF